jgi:hypothetical protein
MTGKLLSVCSLVLVLALPGSAGAGDVRLTIHDGRVVLSARDATLRQILLEWERVGGTRIVNRDRVPGTLLTLELVDVPERQALETLLRSAAGYVAATRLDPASGASQYSRIILMPGAAAFAPAGAAPAMAASGPSGSGMGGAQAGRPQVQRRVMPDGRVVTIMDDLQQPGDPDDTEDNPPPAGGSASMMRPPFPVPARIQQGQSATDPALVDQQSPPSAAPAMKSAPTIPVTIAAPGALPAAKQYPPQPGPPKPPGR